jgi:hypothetical protein
MPAQKLALPDLVRRQSEAPDTAIARPLAGPGAAAAGRPAAGRGASPGGPRTTQIVKEAEE